MGKVKNATQKNGAKKLNVKGLKQLSQEIREQIILTAKTNGGHLSSNLGVVETTVALNHVFDFSSDKLLFDVGHQCYAHKILNGRQQNFATLRQKGGISGFPDKDENQADLFTVGHAGTAMASALGLCSARDKLGQDFCVISFIGDGSIVNGLNLEALSASNEKPKNLIVILNDNGMGISKNKNGLYQLLSKGTTKKSYVNSKKAIRKIFGSSFITRGLAGIRNFIKRVVNKNNYFENHGFKYVGVVDGHDMKELVTILSRVKEVAKTKAVLLHVKTVKGKGLDVAEERSDVYHGVGKGLTNEMGSFSKCLGEQINALIEKDDKVMAITAGMSFGTGLKEVETLHHNNFVDVGIAEEYAVTFASGLAKGGLKPFVCVYSTFLQRAYDQIVHDVCLQNLPVVFCIDRAGLVGQDGKTHQGVFDLSYLSHIPNLTVLAPNTTEELCDAINYAYEANSPVAIRYPKNAIKEDCFVSLKDCAWKRVCEGDKVSIIAVGPKMLELAKKVAQKFEGVGVISARKIKPLCDEVLQSIKNTFIITLEENVISGGFGSSVATHFAIKGEKVDMACLGVKDEFVAHASVDEQLEENGLNEEKLTALIKAKL